MIVEKNNKKNFEYLYIVLKEGIQIEAYAENEPIKVEAVNMDIIKVLKGRYKLKCSSNNLPDYLAGKEFSFNKNDIILMFEK